jgi:antitoxin HigA-1
MQLSMNKLAMDLHVPVTRIAEIVHERRGITPDTVLRLARYFHSSARLWLNLQAAYDLKLAEDELAHDIEQEVRPAATLPTSLTLVPLRNIFIFLREKSFATFSAKMHSAATILLLTLTHRPQHNALTSLHQGKRRSRPRKISPTQSKKF